MPEETRSESAMRSRPRQILLKEDIRRLIVFALTILVIVPGCALVFGGRDGWQNGSWRPSLNTAAFAAAPLATRIHAIFILTMVVTGWGMLALPKGDLRHRVLGWTWIAAVTLMGITSMTVPHGDSWISASSAAVRRWC
jgi:hypothetical protein